MDKRIHRISDRIKKLLRKKQINNKKLKPYRCPNCKFIAFLESKFIQDEIFCCPSCGQKSILKITLEKPEKKYEKLNNLKSWLSQISINAIIIGLIVTIIGILFLFRQNPLTTKLSLTLIIIGAIFPLFITEKKQNTSIIITFATFIFIIILFFVTGTDLEIFFILIFLGVFITKAVIEEYLHEPLKISMNIFLSIFFIIFVILVIKRIINLVGI